MFIFKIPKKYLPQLVPGSLGEEEKGVQRQKTKKDRHEKNVNSSVQTPYHRQRRRGSTRRGGWLGWHSHLCPRRWPLRTSRGHCRTHRSDMVLVSTHPGPQTHDRQECSSSPCLRGRQRAIQRGVWEVLMRHLWQVKTHTEIHWPLNLMTVCEKEPLSEVNTNKIAIFE